MRLRLVLGLAAALLVIPLTARAGPGDRFPSANPDPRVGTPNDPGFDCAEPDDEDHGECTNIWDEQVNLFGFGPSDTQLTATYHDAARFGQPQRSGVGADRAWKYSIGRADVTVAVTDTGIRWEKTELAPKVRLNEGELPKPQGSDTHDVNGDGAVTIADYAGDSRVTDANGNGIADGQDAIRAFEDGVDDDGNGYVDDIAGWDFFDDDNDPEDTSSYSSAHNHGSGRAGEAIETTNDGEGDAGVCPNCTLLPLRVWDSFVVIGDQFGMATTYAADRGASSEVVALGVLQNTTTARDAVHYAYTKGLVITSVSSDLNTANHNYPTNYNEPIFINGCVADTHGLGTDVPAEAGPFRDLFGPYVGSELPILTWFRNSNLTQYGGHAHVCMVGTTGSEATGQAGGAAALLVSRGRDVADEIGGPLTAGEVKQILTMTAEDVLPENTLGVGVPDHAQPGWDQHFGYGRADLGAAMAAIAPGQIPPEVLLDGPAWWAMLPASGLAPVTGHISANRAGHFEYVLQWAPGLEPHEGEFRTFATGDGDGGDEIDGELGRIPLSTVAATMPGAANGTPPASPNDYVFTVRAVVLDDHGNRGEDRRSYFAFDDPDLLDGWPRFVDTGGESAPVLADLDGDGTLEVVEADSSGRITVTRADGTPLPSFNAGKPWLLSPTWNAHLDAPGFKSGAVTKPTGGWRTPAVYDVDGDLAPEIVASAVDGRLYVIEADGSLTPGFPVGVDPSLSPKAERNENNHTKRGFLANPAIGDLDGDGAPEIVAGALDGYVYVWEGDGSMRPGFPRRLIDLSEAEPKGGEIISTPALADLDGDGTLEIVVESSEVYGETADTDPEAVLEVLQRALQDGPDAINAFGRLYAIRADGKNLPGWPIALGGLLPDILPLVAPAMNVAAGDLDGDGADEIVAGIVSGTQSIIDGDGSVIRSLRNIGPTVGGHSVDPVNINLAEYPVIGALGDGGLTIAKGGATLDTVINLLLVGQNLPYDHIVQAWDASTGEYKAGFPRPVEDYTILSTPAIADVAGDGDREIVAGTGLYLIHAFDALGEEAPGFPKLTGGWNATVPAIGDLDGDGTLEMVAGTREGWRFAWELGTPVAGGNEWPTDGHDPCHTNRYGADCVPPARPPSISITADGEIRYGRSGDDGFAGAAKAYEVRVSDRPIETYSDWAAATPVDSSRVGSAGFAAAAVVAIDDAGNRSPFASALAPGAVVVDLPDAPATPGGGPLPARTGGFEPWLVVALLGIAAATLRMGARRAG